MSTLKRSSSDRKSPSPKRIFIVEDHPAFREGLMQIIAGEKDLAICGHAGSALRAIRAIRRLKPDLVLVDITLPGMSGLELIKELRKTDRKVKLLVISMHDEALYADRVLRAGGDGFIMKQEDPQEITHAIRDVLGGHLYLSEQVMAGPGGGARTQRPACKTRALEHLTDIELEIMEALGQGKSNAEIARSVKVSSAKVAEHCGRIQKKLKLKSINGLIRCAVCWVESGGE
jgi:DNA-binding NarL/FixJ family response regulator